MPTRKQRRRRAKEHRHEYVWEDAEGNELDRSEASAETPARPQRAPAHPGRQPQAPSWRRTLRRALIFAPLMFVVVYVLSGDLTPAQQITQTALIVAIFIPFSFLLDSFFYRGYLKRTARRERADRGRGS